MAQRYIVKGKIGQGGLGDVFLATDTQLDRDVALKRVRPPEEGDGGVAGLQQDLIREARTLSSLQHPNIVTIYDVGKDENGPFVVMEFLKGETLDQVIDRGAMTVDDFQEVVVQSLEGMIAAQAMGLVHRDLKPGNLMVIWLASGKFQIKILDFGLAKFSLTATRQTEDQESGIMGTIYFMAPEQFERLPLDARTDMYSLGCIFYQILTTKPPFDGQTGPEVMVSHLQHHVIHLVDARPDMPVWMADWVMWLISREMDDRPSDARTALDFFRISTSGIKNPTPQAVIPKGSMVKIVGRGRGPGGVATVVRSGTTQRMQGTAATARISRPAAKRIVRKKKRNAGLWITLALLAAGGAGAAWYFIGKKPPPPPADSALQALLASPAPPDDANSWNLLVSSIQNGDGNAAKAIGILKKMSGAPLAELLARELEKSTGAARLTLMEAVADHPTTAATAQLLKIAGSEPGGVRTAALQAAGRTAKVSDLDQLLHLLPKITAGTNRELVFHAATAALSRDSDPPTPHRLRPAIDALRGADNLSRPGLLRLLATSTEPAATLALNALFAIPGDSRTDAMAILPDWAVPLPSTAEALLAAADSPTDREALINAYCHLAPRIASWDGAELTAALRKAQPHVTSALNRENLAAALGMTAAPEATSYAQELAKSGADWAGPASKAEKASTALRGEAFIITPGEHILPAAKAIIQGAEKDAYYTATSRYITNWKDAKSRLAWDLVISEAGRIAIGVLQSGSSKADRSFRIRLAAGVSEKPVRSTPSNEDFLPVDAGSFQVPHPGTWRLWMEPAVMESGQPLMNLRELTLTFNK